MKRHSAGWREGIAAAPHKRRAYRNWLAWHSARRRAAELSAAADSIAVQLLDAERERDRALTELYQLRVTVSRLLGYEDPIPAGALRDILAGATIRLPDRW